MYVLLVTKVPGNMTSICEKNIQPFLEYDIFISFQVGLLDGEHL